MTTATLVTCCDSLSNFVTNWQAWPVVHGIADTENLHASMWPNPLTGMWLFNLRYEWADGAGGTTRFVRRVPFSRAHSRIDSSSNKIRVVLHAASMGC